MARRSIVLSSAASLLALCGCFDPSDAGLGDTDSVADAGTTGAPAVPSGPQGTTTGASPPSTSDDDEGSSGAPDVDDGGADETGEADASTGVAVEPCPSDHACVAEVPPGWMGPVVLSLEGAPCPAEFPAVVFEGVSDLDAASASCGCSCDGSALCGPITVQHFAGCTFPTILHDTDWLDPSGECTPLAQDPDALSINLGLFSEGQPGGCEPVAQVEVPEPTWGTSARVCGGAFLPEGCDDEVCAPTPPRGFESEVCIAREGVSGCPGDFPVQRTFATDVEDSRGCTACECGVPSGVVQCSASVRLSDTADCSNAVISDVLVDAPVCQPALATMQYGRVESMDVLSGGCAPSGGEPVGEAVPTGEMTVCCRS